MSTPESPQPEKRERPVLLRAMLILWMAGSGISICSVLADLSGRAIAYTVLDHPEWAILPIGLLSLVNLVCVIALWKWKRWGMYGLAFSATAMFIITLISLNITNAIISIVGVIIIGLLVRRVWNLMD
jgi:hypothetical protein